MQIFKPRSLGLISRTYTLGEHYFSVGALGFFKLGCDRAYLVENECWRRLGPFFKSGTPLDMGYAKPRSEFLLVGNAYSPQQKPIESMSISAQVGALNKQIDVVGDRQWDGRSPSSTTQPIPFTTMPISHQQTYGGVGYEHNPLGKGFSPNDDQRYDLPNLSLPQKTWPTNGWPPLNRVKNSERDSAPACACFEPLDIMWPQRNQYQGTYDQTWLKTVHPGFPHDTQSQLFNSASTDQQQVKPFSVNTAYQLKGLHPSQPTIEGRLPPFVVRAFVAKKEDAPRYTSKPIENFNALKAGSTFLEITTKIETIWFFPELDIGVVLHRGVLAVQDSDGLDISHLLLAYERKTDEPRSLEHYQQSLVQRADPKTAAEHISNELPLKPRHTAEDQKRIDKLWQQAQAEQQTRKQDMLNVLAKDNPHLAASSEAEPHTAAGDAQSDKMSCEEMPAIPKALVASGDVDLSQYLAQANALSDRSNQEAERIIQSLSALQNAGSRPKSFDQNAPQTTVDISALRARIDKPVYVFAIDLAAQTDETPDSVDSTLQYLSPEQRDQLKTARDVSAVAARQSRQTSPQCTLGYMALTPQTKHTMRDWVINRLDSGLDLAGCDLSDLDLSNMDFSKRDLRDVMFERADLTGSRFNQSNLEGAVFVEASLDDTSFKQANLSSANLSAVKAQNIDFESATFHAAQLIGSTLHDCSFTDSIFSKASVMDSDLARCRFSAARCEQTQFIQTILANTQWDNASLMNNTFLQCRMTDSCWQAAQLSRCIMVDIEATGANFEHVQANKVQFSSHANFQSAILNTSRWEGCGFRQLDLSGCSATQSVFIDCDFGETTFDGARLEAALFRGCILMLAHFKASHCGQSVFLKSNLRKVHFCQSVLEHAQILHCNTTEMTFDHCDTRGYVQRPQIQNHHR